MAALAGAALMAKVLVSTVRVTTITITTQEATTVKTYAWDMNSDSWTLCTCTHTNTHVNGRIQT